MANSTLPEEDRADIRPNIPGLRTQEGIGTNTAGRSSGGSSSSTTGSNGGARSATKASDGGATSPTGSGFYNGEGDSAAKSLRTAEKNTTPLGSVGAITKNNRFNLVRRFGKKKAASGGIIGTIIGFVVVVATISQGPLQIVHLAEVLKTSFSGHEDETKIRLNGIYRYARTGNPGETRLGYLGSKMANGSIDTWSKLGIEIQTDATFGSIKSVTYDTGKLKESFPELENMTAAERKAFISEQFNIPTKDLANLGSGSDVNGSKFFTNRTASSSTSDAALLKAQAKVLPNGKAGSLLKLPGGEKVITAVKIRPVAEFYGVPSVWHPIKGKVADLKKRAGVKIDRSRKASTEREAERAKTRAPVETSAYVAARDDLKSKINGNAGKLTGALLLTQGMCLIRSVANDVPEANRGAIVIPSVIEAADKTAAGSQIMDSNDFSNDQAADISNSFTDDNGKTIWQSRALLALSDPNTTQGEDISPGYKQAFMKDTTAANIKSTLGGGDLIGGSLCSPAGQVLQLAAGLTLIVATPLTDGASLGTFAAVKGGEVAATAGAIYFLQKEAVNYFKTDKAVPAVFSGPVGGGLMAYGSRELANVGERADGGVALNSKQSAEINQNTETASQKDFHSKSLFAQMFDIHDYRTPSSKAIDQLSKNPLTNVATISRAALNFAMSIIPHTFSSLFPSAKAASPSKPYDWGFPQYGIPSEVLQDKNMQDPYDNGDKVAAIMDDTSNPDYATGLKNRAMKCFGVEINKGDDGWGVVAKTDVNPTSEDYVNANCSDLSDPNWKRIMLFIFDTRTMDAVSCYEGTDDSCTTLGAGSQGSTKDASSDSQTTDAAPIKVDASDPDLTKDSTSLKCAENTKDLGIQDGYSNGNKVKIRVCAVSNIASSGGESNDQYGVSGAGGKLVVNARVSAVMYQMGEAAKADHVTLSASSGFRTMAHQQCLYDHSCGAALAAAPGTSNHQMGLAVDFAVDICSTTIDGQCSDPGDPIWDWLHKNAAMFGYKSGVPSEAWHWSPTGN